MTATETVAVVSAASIVEAVEARLPAHANRKAGRSVPWAERSHAIRQVVPSTSWGTTDWYDALGDYNLLGRIMRDVLKVGWEPPTRRGQRGPLEWDEGMARMEALTAEREGHITLVEFNEAFAKLAGNRAMRHVAIKVGLTKSQVNRLLLGQIKPTMAELERIAAAFGKPPTFFVEYRVNMICAMIADSLITSPERTVDVLARLNGGLPGRDDE